MKSRIFLIHYPLFASPFGIFKYTEVHMTAMKKNFAKVLIISWSEIKAIRSMQINVHPHLCIIQHRLNKSGKVDSEMIKHPEFFIALNFSAMVELRRFIVLPCYFSFSGNARTLSGKSLIIVSIFNCI